MKRKQIISIGLAMTMLVCVGCQKSPEDSIVKNKDFDQMVDQAQDEESGVSDVSQMTEYDTYQDTFSDESLGVTVNVDAKVDIPTTDQMSIVRIRQKEISQEFLDQVKEALMPEVALCDASKLNASTKSTIEKEIAGTKRLIEEVEAQFAAGEMDEQSLEVYKAEYQQSIDELQEQYELAPQEVKMSDYPSDGQLHAVTDLVSQEPDNDYYQFQKELNPNGSVYYGAGEGADGYHTLYVQNNDSYGNFLSYRKSKTRYLGNTGISMSGQIEKNLETLSEKILGGGESRDIEPDSTQLSQQEAQAVADAFINDLKLEEYRLYDGDLYYEFCGASEEGDLEYRKVYVFQYLRNLDGVYVNNEGSSKLTDGWQGDEYIKKEWPGESVQVYVNDSGVVEFHYLVPIEMVETVVEKSGMKSFDEIKDIFKQMIVVTNATEYEEKTINIDRVVLRYTRISEADNFDTGLLVPVWDFEGSIASEFDKVPVTGSLLTINAIDGTVIDKQLGY